MKPISGKMLRLVLLAAAVPVSCAGSPRLAAHPQTALEAMIARLDAVPAGRHPRAGSFIRGLRTIEVGRQKWDYLVDDEHRLHVGIAQDHDDHHLVAAVIDDLILKRNFLARRIHLWRLHRWRLEDQKMESCGIYRLSGWPVYYKEFDTGIRTADGPLSEWDPRNPRSTVPLSVRRELQRKELRARELEKDPHGTPGQSG